jgi:hypothetical protein
VPNVEWRHLSARNESHRKEPFGLHDEAGPSRSPAGRQFRETGLVSFSKRHGYRRPLPERDLVEEAPEAVRALLRRMMLADWGALGAYRRMCEVLEEVPDADVWSNQGAASYVDHKLGQLEWFEVFDLLEELCSGVDDDEVNGVFARCGLVYEMGDGQIHLFDPEGDELGVTGSEFEAVSYLKGDYAAVRAQYQRALDALHGRPADLERAVADALNALEAVARVISGDKDFGKAIDASLNGRPHAGALGATLKALYGWASQLPGARHGRHEEPDLSYDDAFLAVRLAGAAIVYLITNE